MQRQRRPLVNTERRRKRHARVVCNRTKQWLKAPSNLRCRHITMTTRPTGLLQLAGDWLVSSVEHRAHVRMHASYCRHRYGRTLRSHRFLLKKKPRQDSSAQSNGQLLPVLWQYARGGSGRAARHNESDPARLRWPRRRCMLQTGSKHRSHAGCMVDTMWDVMLDAMLACWI